MIMGSTTPCDGCKHSQFEMVEQFTYRTWCDIGCGAFESPWGCYKFKKPKKKGDKHRKKVERI